MDDVAHPDPSTPAAQPPRRPLIVAHRGASTEAPEHTYAAYVAALSAGADALECDVRLTADGHLVCVHDRRVDRTSNGTGRVSALELARLEELDFGSWHVSLDRPAEWADGLGKSGGAAEADRSGGTAEAERSGAAIGTGAGTAGVTTGSPAAATAGVTPGSPATAAGSAAASAVGSAAAAGSASASAAESEEPDRDTRGVLTLRRLLDLVAAQPRRVELAIEVKHPTRYAGRVERELVALLDEYGWAPRSHAIPCPVRVMSFSASAVRRMRRLAPGLSTVFLMEPLVYRARGGALPRGVPIAGPSIEILRRSPESVHRWQRAGHEVHVWTVDDPADFELCLELGVDAVITNRPRAILRALSAAASSPAE